MDTFLPFQTDAFRAARACWRRPGAPGAGTPCELRANVLEFLMNGVADWRGGQSAHGRGAVRLFRHGKSG